MERVRTGIAGLDQMLDGGFLPQTANLIEGAPGTGKTTIGMEFINHGVVEYNESGIILTFEEFPKQYYRDAGTFLSIQVMALETVPETPTYSFAQISDPQFVYEHPIATQLGHTFGALRREGASFAIIAGDMCENGLAQQFHVLAKAIRAGNGLAVHGCMGNHESYFTTCRPDA